MIKLAIIEYEPKVRHVIRAAILDTCWDADIVGEADSMSTALTLLNAQKPDVVLLDVNLKDGTAFDLLAHFQSRTFKVIFLTAHEQYALAALKSHADDFLLKPVDPTELCNAIKEAVADIFTSGRPEALQKPVSGNGQIHLQGILVFQTTYNTFFVQKNEITYCTSDHGYTTIFLASGKKITISKTLKEVEEKIDDNQSFLRIHQSYLVNVNHIYAFDKREGGFIEMADGTKIPVSERKRSLFLNISS